MIPFTAYIHVHVISQQLETCTCSSAGSGLCCEGSKGRLQICTEKNHIHVCTGSRMYKSDDAPHGVFLYLDSGVP